MADYDTFREQLAIMYPSYGHALWAPSPREPDRPVQVGDVGFVRRGKFHRLFNALLPADHPSHELGVPEYHEPLVPTSIHHLDTDSLDRDDYCSAGVSVETDPGYHSGSGDFPKVSFRNKGTRRAAVLSLPVTARREDTFAWAWAGDRQMEEIILVTGCDLTRSWTNVAFLGNEVDSKPEEVSFGVNVEGPDTVIKFRFSPGNARGTVLRHGPQGTNLPENQCVFIRGFRVARSFRIFPGRMKPVAPSPDLGGSDCDPDMEVILIPAVTKVKDSDRLFSAFSDVLKYRDPLHVLLDHISEQAPDCDMVLAHDDDLVTIDGLGHESSLETLEPDVMMNLFRRSSIEIHKVSCDLCPTGPNTDSSVVKVAMLSMKSQNRRHGLVELPTKPLEKQPHRIDTSIPSPKRQLKRPGPLNLQATIKPNDAWPLPSTLATARYIEDINLISYPQGIERPRVELNINTQKGKFRYDRYFLLQFMDFCKEKPDNLNLSLLKDHGLEPRETPYRVSRDGSSRNRATSNMSIPADPRSASIGPGSIQGSAGESVGSGFKTGKFSSGRKMTSEERFLAASAGRSVSVVGEPLGNRPTAMVRTISQSGTVSANRWVATSTRRCGPGLGGESPEIVKRKVKGLLNKLTMERFDSISDQIIAWANKSEKEKDGRTLIQVTKLIFENATDEEMFSGMYARMCRKMMERISPKVEDDGIKNAEGKPFAGGQLFRKYLLYRCQECFERGWALKETTADATDTKATEGQAVKKKKKKKQVVKKANETKGSESELYSGEYFGAAEAKRRGLARIRFICELFMLQMLTESIVHEYVRKLLASANLTEEEIENLCKLLTQVGSVLDSTKKARAHLDVYFLRMRELTEDKNVNPRMAFLLQDVIDLRERKWIPRSAIATTSTIAQVCELAVNERLAQENNAYMRQKASLDLATDALSHPTSWRRKLKLLPRSTPVGEESKASTSSVSN